MVIACSSIYEAPLSKNAGMNPGGIDRRRIASSFRHWQTKQNNFVPSSCPRHRYSDILPERIAMLNTLIVPGLYGSGPGHWQSWLEQRLPHARRVVQDDWSTPDLPRWSRRVQECLARSPRPTIIVAHSFGCLASMAAARKSQRIVGALLVAPANPRKFGVGRHLPVTPASFPTIVVASTNDPWVSLAFAQRWAARWGSRFIKLGRQGHINTEAGFGPWPEGLRLYEMLCATVFPPATASPGNRTRQRIVQPRS
jgi:predicted alpha/beta hydrolase family esterase